MDAVADPKISYMAEDPSILGMPEISRITQRPVFYLNIRIKDIFSPIW
jgi:hypothetical protein